MLQIYGVPISAHTRKVIVTALEKRVPFEVTPVVPLDPPEGWRDKSPLGKIPVVQDDDLTLVDSSVICDYLERKYPEVSIYPAHLRQRAKSLWLEEFVDGSLAGDILSEVLRPLMLDPLFGGKKDVERAKKAVEDVIPGKLDYVQREIEGPFSVGNMFTIADVTLASILINYHYAGQRLDEGRHRTLNEYLIGLLERPSIQKALAAEAPFAQKLGLDCSWRR